MTEYWFDESGHLTDEALSLLAGGEEPPLLQRLEAAEHLAYCAPCMQRYTTLLEGGVLAAPAPGIADAVLAIGGRQKRLVFFRQLAKAAACACLALVVWGLSLPLTGGRTGPPAGGVALAAQEVRPVTQPYKTPLLDALEGWSTGFSNTARQAGDEVLSLLDKKDTDGGQNGTPRKEGDSR